MRSVAASAALLLLAVACSTSNSTRGGTIPSRTFTPTPTAQVQITPSSTHTPTGTPRIVFVSNRGSASVSVMREQFGLWSVPATIPVGPSPEGLAASWDGSWLYVAEHGSGGIRVVNAQSYATATVIPVGGGPREIAVNTPGTRLYVTDFTGNRVVAVDLSTGGVVATVTCGPGPWGIAVAPGTDTVFVATSSGAVAAFAGSNLAPIATVTVGPQARGVALRSGTADLFVTDPASPRISVVDTGSWTVVSTLSSAQGLDPGPQIPGFSPTGARCHVPCETAGTVQVVNSTGSSIVATVPVGLLPYAAAATRDGAFVLVSNAGSANVTVLDGATAVVVATLAVGSVPRGLAARP